MSDTNTAFDSADFYDSEDAEALTHEHAIDCIIDHCEGLPSLEELARYSSKVRPWACEEVDRRTYTAEEIEVLLRVAVPQWFPTGR